MENVPEAAPQGTEATPIQSPNEAQVLEKTPEISAEQVAQYLGTNAETLGKFQKFVEANGKFDNAFSKLKSDISTPKSAQTFEPEAQPAPTSQPQAPVEPQYKMPAGAITQQEFMAQQYFQALSREEKYAPIAKGIENGDYLKEMAAFGINALNQDGSINDRKVRMYLDLKAQTVPATSTSTEPNASTAPTVEYYQVEGDKITDMNQAYAILDQDMKLRAKGQVGHPLISQAEEFIKTKGKPAK